MKYLNLPIGCKLWSEFAEVNFLQGGARSHSENANSEQVVVGMDNTVGFTLFPTWGRDKVARLGATIIAENHLYTLHF